MNPLFFNLVYNITPSDGWGSPMVISTLIGAAVIALGTIAGMSQTAIAQWLWRRRQRTGIRKHLNVVVGLIDKTKQRKLSDNDEHYVKEDLDDFKARISQVQTMLWQYTTKELFDLELDNQVMESIAIIATVFIHIDKIITAIPISWVGAEGPPPQNMKTMDDEGAKLNELQNKLSAVISTIK